MQKKMSKNEYEILEKYIGSRFADGELIDKNCKLNVLQLSKIFNEHRETVDGYKVKYKKFDIEFSLMKGLCT